MVAAARRMCHVSPLRLRCVRSRKEGVRGRGVRRPRRRGAAGSMLPIWPVLRHGLPHGASPCAARRSSFIARRSSFNLFTHCSRPRDKTTANLPISVMAMDEAADPKAICPRPNIMTRTDPRNPSASLFTTLPLNHQGRTEGELNHEQDEVDIPDLSGHTPYGLSLGHQSES